MEWTDETIARLRDLWSQGLSTAEIGRQLSITKNAVVGKAHRLGLPPRPSPIRNRKAADGEAGTTEAAPRRKSPSKAKAVEAAGSDLFTDGSKDAAPAKAASGVVEKTAETPARKAPSAPEAPKAPIQPVAAARVVSPVQKEAVAAAPHREAPITPPKPEPRVAPVPRPAVPPRFSTAGIDRPTRRGPSCCWPIGDPGTPGFHFCGATPLPGKPYCAEHAAIAYVKIRDRRD